MGLSRTCFINFIIAYKRKNTKSLTIFVINVSIDNRKGSPMKTLKELLAAEKLNAGRIYWRYADSTYSSTPEPVWIPQSLVPRFFGRER